MRIEISEKRWEEVAETINNSYDTLLKPDQIKEALKGFSWLLTEIEEGTYEDTSPRECILEYCARSIIGEPWPCFGTAEETTRKFYDKAVKVGLLEGRYVS